MDYGWSTNLHDNEGDIYEQCLLVHIGDNTIIKFKDSVELEQFAERILASLNEIRESEARNE